MTDPIDYSRPVGWWCPVCGYARAGKWASLDCDLLAYPIPVYLPLPTPEPVEVDEVETGEAEVVTFVVGGMVWIANASDLDRNVGCWTDVDMWPIEQHHIDHVANALKKRGEAK